jgi:hypothetical protein
MPIPWLPAESKQHPTPSIDARRTRGEGVGDLTIAPHTPYGRRRSIFYMAKHTLRVSLVASRPVPGASRLRERGGWLAVERGLGRALA